MTDQVHDMVRERYAAAANQAASGSGACCGPEAAHLLSFSGTFFAGSRSSTKRSSSPTAFNSRA